MGKKTPKINSRYLCIISKRNLSIHKQPNHHSNWLWGGRDWKAGKEFFLRLESLKAPLQVTVKLYKVEEKYIKNPIQFIFFHLKTNLTQYSKLLSCYPPKLKCHKNQKNNALKANIQWFKELYTGTSLVAQWLRIRLPMQGTWVPSLVWEDPTSSRATKPLRHNYWARMPQILKPVHLEPMLHNERSHCNEKPAQIGRASCRERV